MIELIPAYSWVIILHWDNDHQSPAIGPFGDTEAERMMTMLRKLYRAAGQKPIKIEKKLLRSPEVAIDWVRNHIDRNANDPDTFLDR